MSEWHGYEQGEARHPGRPWWRWVAYEDRKGDERDMLVRIDGREAAAMTVSVLEIAEEIDREHPLPVPPPKCGQVWVWLGDAVTERSVVSRHSGVAWFQAEVGRVGQSGGVEIAQAECWGCADANWPPAGAVLVAGPGAPWAPMGAP
jgi:hypothetical protein